MVLSSLRIGASYDRLELGNTALLDSKGCGAYGRDNSFSSVIVVSTCGYQQ